MLQLVEPGRDLPACRKMKPLRPLAAAAVAAVASCASPEDPSRAYLDAPSEQVHACAGWYRALDRAVDESGVRDARHARVPGFPYLRVDRMFASLASRAGRDLRATRAYAERLGELDLESRAHEINNLPRERFETLPGMGPNSSRDLALRRTGDCARLLRELDLAKPQARAALLRAARVPDDDPAASEGVSVSRGISPRSFPVVRYAPPAALPLPRAAIGGLLTRGRFDPLGQPLLSQRELERLAALYAPSFEIATGGDRDRFGEVLWRGGEAPEVEASTPAVYIESAYTRYGEQVLLQIVYTIWFPERPAGQGVDSAGGLDGIVWRVTLASDGEPLLYDSIHPCGCDHQFFPTPHARPRAGAGAEERAFVRQRLPRVMDGERPLIRLASGTHAIERVSLVHGIDSLARYVVRPYDELRSLPRPDGSRASIFGPRGGRHFDDADLLERRVELDLDGEGE